MFYLILYIVSQVVLFGAWVSGTLDPYQKRLQEMLLEAMGDTKVSYGLKSTYPSIEDMLNPRERKRIDLEERSN
jgi:hypothetical protein